MFYGARVRVPIDATDGEVLVVPVAALTVGPDEIQPSGGRAHAGHATTRRPRPSWWRSRSV